METNYEHYKKEIDAIWKQGQCVGLRKSTNEVVACNECPCKECEFYDEDTERCVNNVQRWLVSEYKDPAEDVDWSKVPVDTPVLVKQYDSSIFRKI